ncbi:MAG: electron transfer flavoprotein subunit alpha/FixB family protein [Syntrophomonas sp.]|uniref:electron transfer flavoprotein subunit alpha/FixB family protein n=1 Tax=Syntrophomonas sp. TaxID=2053627 RepID=UPI002613C195|nr:electron transfer flavoprotein subunit alpha/FixB family protein [Syntrophomonas sp.]MDD2510060.1 electron transfer flavoprotein subunit alpha/FixB family protein [Syntrophomonas sp.]MDD3879012.1 electron transfer flavoprotein subunit alpha/FixB family protein [Syntrophomonas sp.]MDD4626762.1 electron transfer flavoprotein subunit alpha/FixB family protein [Syntrophomonas sp.]
MAGILIYSDKDNLALELLTVARLIADARGLEVKVACINNASQSNLLSAAGVRVYKIENPAVIPADVATVAAALKEASGQLDCSIVLLSSNRRGRELAGRLAQMLGAGCLTDISAVKVEGEQIHCQRNALGGATVATQYIDGDKQVLVIVPRAFTPASAQDGGSIVELAVEVLPSRVKLLEFRAKDSSSVDIEEAPVLVVVGQGLNSQEDLASVESLAKKLGGEVACSKPLATDKKWLPEDRVVGLSGKKCQPDLAVLLGISGQVQFTVGIRDAQVMVAVNSDENAYIHQIADYSMVADLHQVVKELNDALA